MGYIIFQVPKTKKYKKSSIKVVNTAADFPTLAKQIRQLKRGKTEEELKSSNYRIRKVTNIGVREQSKLRKIVKK